VARLRRGRSASKRASIVAVSMSHACND
jgi:hypothetical protein